MFNLGILIVNAVGSKGINKSDPFIENIYDEVALYHNAIPTPKNEITLTCLKIYKIYKIIYKII